MPDTARRYTVQDVRDFPPDGNRYELVHGELLVTPAPRPEHQIVVVELHDRISPYLAANGGGARLFSVAADISWDDETLVQPDLFVVPAAEVSRDWRTYRTLLLAVEVLSPGSSRADRVVKRRRYQEQGVATYWVVDVDARLVEVWHPDDERPEIVPDLLRWRVSPAARELVIDLAEVFSRLPE
ncbi:MAG TPA: Uma2 family endonuclease [Gemmatimonadales bacterium]|nr:Uma2 family endonuclease [Gemmatimonadales bacterium]